MLNLIINGAAGRMGQALTQIITANPDKYQLVFAADTKKTDATYRPLAQFTGNADCIIDFSHHAATKELTEFAITKQLPLVVATTGQTSDELELLHQAATQVPIFLAANMSLGIASLIKLVKQATQLFPDADIEIIEQHHNKKLDVPSGTALAIANAIKTVRPDSKLVVGRHEFGERNANEIGIHSLRLGNVVGIHEILITNGAETLTLRHEAQSRSVFALGALHAAEFLTTQASGCYEMNDLLKGL